MNPNDFYMVLYRGVECRRIVEDKVEFYTALQQEQNRQTQSSIRIENNSLIPQRKSQYKCVTCNKTFTKRSRFIAHYIGHEKPFSCIVCDTKSSTKNGQFIHFATHIMKKTFPCTFRSCPSVLSTKVGFINHQLMVHGILRPFSHEQKLVRTIGRSSIQVNPMKRIKSYKSVGVQCEEREFFTSTEQLSAVQQQQQGLKQFQIQADGNGVKCMTCELQFYDKDEMVKHIVNTHIQILHVVAKSTTQNTEPQNSQTFEENRSEIISLTDSLSSRTSVMTSHKMSTQEENRIKIITSTGSLSSDNSSTTSSHTHSLSIKEGIREYENSALDEQTTATRHTQHKSVGPSSMRKGTGCRECGVTFPTKKVRLTHHYAYHKKDHEPYKCGSCMRQCSSLKRLTIHYGLCHPNEQNMGVQIADFITRYANS